MRMSGRNSQTLFCSSTIAETKYCSASTYLVPSEVSIDGAWLHGGSSLQYRVRPEVEYGVMCLIDVPPSMVPTRRSIHHANTRRCRLTRQAELEHLACSVPCDLLAGRLLLHSPA